MPSSEPLYVLVVDDDEGVRNLLCRILTREGHTVMPSGSAEEALELLPRCIFQAAFIDHHLPGMEGVVFGEYLRRNNPDMQIALVTGDDTRRLERQSRAASISFIRKPFDVGEILRVIDAYRSAIAERQALEERRQAGGYDPPFAEFAEQLAGYYDISSTPRRAHDQLVEGIKRSLYALRSESRYAELDRVAALAGLLTARVLGVPLPKGADGASLFEEYDEAMRRHGRRPEFGG
jgi:CheY-like chemotaxis protein